MRILVIQHVGFEGPGAIARWAAERGHTVETVLALTEEFPPPAQFDMLVVMGGPMDADDEAASPWLTAEKTFIRSIIAAEKPVLGVCLGSQILAEVLGGRVKRGAEPEIGWYPVHFTASGGEASAFTDFPDGLVVGHWHGDTFDLPEGIAPVLSSSITPNQAYQHGKVVGVQFHLEWTAEALDELITACPADLTGLDWASSEDEMRAWGDRYMPAANAALMSLLDRIAAL